MYHMIIIDDDAGISNNLDNLFPWEQSGFHVDEKFYDGYTALQYLKSHEVDLIISDIRMPVLNGIELAKWIHDQKRRERIIFISGFKDFDYAQQAMEYGVSYYCLKPVTYREIKEKLVAIIPQIENEKKIRKEQPESFSGEISQKDSQIKKIKKYIRDNYFDFRLDGLSEYMKKNSSYISRFFSENTGYTVTEYLTEIRMRKGLQILHDTDLSVRDVAQEVGYTNPVSFSNAFRKRYSVSPADYRSKYSLINDDKDSFKNK